MKFAVIRFPGSNCDQDCLHALRDDMGMDTDYVWHKDGRRSTASTPSWCRAVFPMAITCAAGPSRGFRR